MVCACFPLLLSRWWHEDSQSLLFPSYTQFTSEGCACVLQLCGHRSVSNSRPRPGVMTSPLQPLDFLSQQQRIFPSAGNLCPVSLLMWKRPTQGRADESYSVGLEIPLHIHTYLRTQNLTCTKECVEIFVCRDHAHGDSVNGYYIHHRVQVKRSRERLIED